MQNLSFVSLDLETTGLAESAEIIEIGMVKVKDGQIIDRFEQLVKPKRGIPEEITLLTGITNNMVAHAPHWQEIEKDVLSFLGDSLLVAHNISFDRSMLENHLGYETENYWLDTHDMAKIFLPTLTSYKLISIAGALAIHGDDFHRASSDAEICAKVLLKIIAIAIESDPFTLQKIADVFANEDNGLSRLLQSLNSYVVSSAVVGQKRVHSFANNDFALGQAPKLTFEHCDDFFKNDGLMSQASPSFQYRPQQLGMLETICRAFREKKHGIIEAGTGTGKSFAYLLPSLLWAFENDCRVIVSTNTIALQEQLFWHDVPFLKKILDYNFSVALSKGRSNYLCLRRHELYKNQLSNMIWAEKIFFATILYWRSITKDGDKEALNLNKMERQFWSNISSQAETCLGNRCTHSRYCYFMQNKTMCEQSDLIITNHALLLQNIKLKSSILPKYDHVIIDEAHNLDEETTKQFTDTLDLEFLRKNNRQLIRKNSLLFRIIAKLKHLPHAGDVGVMVEENLNQLSEDVNQLESYIIDAIEYTFTVNDLKNTNETRITEAIRQCNWWPQFLYHLEQIGIIVTAINFRLLKIYNMLSLIDELEDLTRELMFTQNWYKERETLIQDFLKGDNPNNVYWIEYATSSWGSNLSYSIAPINAMPILKEFLFDANDSVILTSATLAIANDLHYTASTYLLKADDYLSYITPSPFDYQQQSIIAIPTDNPAYNQIGENAYVEMVINNLEQIIPAVIGGVLVLFTSYAMLNKVYFALKQKTNFKEYNILAHGQDGSRTSIIQNLSQVEKTIVLGANSFWEGVDIKGTGLTTVVIVKLPFTPPNRAITSAKMEYIQKQGQNSFTQYSLPQAVLKFRQGSGRLIRSHTDWGALIILDNRIITKKYGAQFLNSLPEQPIIKGPLHEVCKQLRRFMQNKQV